MANWSTLKAAIASIIKTNGNKEITGQLLQNVLNNIVSSVGENSTFAGIATLTTNPGVPDGNVFYLAAESGTYANFSGIEVSDGEAVILEWNGTWIKRMSGLAMQNTLEKKFLSSYPFCKTEVNYHIKEMYIDKDKIPEFTNYGFLYFGFQGPENRYVIQFVGTNDNFTSYTNIVYMTFESNSLLSNRLLEIIKYGTKEVLGYIILNDFTTKTPLYKNVELTDYIFKLDSNPIIFSTINKSLLNDSINALEKKFLSSYPFCKTEVNYHIKEMYIDKDKIPEFTNYGFLYFGFQGPENRYVIQFVGTNDNFTSYTNIVYMTFESNSLLSNRLLEIIKYGTKEVLGYIILNDFTTKTPLYKNVELTDYIFKLDSNPIIFSTINKSLLDDSINKLEKNVSGDNIDLILGGYIPTNTGTIDLENIISNKDYAYKIIDCKAGDKFLINGLGGYTPRLFCFIDADNNTVSASIGNFSAKNYLLSAPANSVKCIFNFITNSSTSTEGFVQPSLYKYDNVYNAFKKNHDFTHDIEDYYYTENLDLNNKIQELYIQDTDYKYYRFVYFFYQKSESRFVIQIKGSNSPDFADEETVVYHKSSNIENKSLITLKKYKGNNPAGYIIVRNFTKEDTSNLAALKPVLVEKSFDLMQNTYIALAANKAVSTLNYPIKTIGALYFDGWTGNSGYSLANKELFPSSTLPDKEGYSDWREYAKAHDSELIKKNHLPPSDCSFSMFYPEQALEKYPSRKPYFGWIINTTEQMEKQIEMAVKYGIDYFVFCFYVGSNDPVFDESGNIKFNVLESNPYNNAVYRFLESNNNYKMKFSVLVCDHGNRTNEKTLFQLLKYINEKFVSHPSFMYINGRPMICIFDSHFQNKIKASHQINGSLLLQNGMGIIPKNGINGRMSYAGAIPSNIGLHPYNDMSNYNNNIINNYYVNIPSYMDIPTVSVGRNEFPRADFITKNETNNYGFVEPTKDELLIHFKKVIDALPKYSKQDQTLLIYAWNEFGEGGYLVPTEGITTTVVNEYPLLDDLGEPILDSSSNPLYYDDYKLQAVKESKEYWIKLVE